MFIFARCLRSSAAVTPAKYELDIIQVTIVFIIQKNWENNGTEKIGLVTPTPGGGSSSSDSLGSSSYRGPLSGWVLATLSETVPGSVADVALDGNPLSNHSTHWGWDKMASIFQTALSIAFSWMKMFKFRLRFHWSLFPRVQLTIFQHWFR